MYQRVAWAQTGLVGIWWEYEVRIQATTHEALAYGKQDETRKYIHNKRQTFPGSR